MQIWSENSDKDGGQKRDAMIVSVGMLILIGFLNTYRMHHLLTVTQVTRTQQLPTKNHASASALHSLKFAGVRPAREDVSTSCVHLGVRAPPFDVEVPRGIQIYDDSFSRLDHFLARSYQMSAQDR